MGMGKIIMFSIVLISTIGIINIVPQAFAHDANPTNGEDYCSDVLPFGFEVGLPHHGVNGIDAQPDGNGEFIITATTFFDVNIFWPGPSFPGLEFGDVPIFGHEVVVVDAVTLLPVGNGHNGSPDSTAGTIGTFVTPLSSSIPPGEYFLVSCWDAQEDEGGPFTTDADRFGPFTVPTPSADHYFGYFVFDRTDPKFSAIPIRLVDQFEDQSYKVLKPIKMYNPASKNREPVQDTVTHLKAYKISGEHTPVTDIILTNQFEQLTVDTRRVVSMLVPTAKSHDGPTDPLIDEPVDDFKCYKLQVIAKFPGDVKKRIRVFDTNFDEVRKVKVIGKPLLCNPVAKFDLTGQQLSEIKNPDLHLTCYKVKPRGADLGHDRIKFDTNNQFGPEVLKTKNHDVLKENGKFKNRHEICVPTMKQIITNG